MGQAIYRATEGSDTCRIVAGVDINASAVGSACPFPVYETITDFPSKADVIVDFSHHTAVAGILAYAKRTGCAAIICTTGHTEEELAMIEAASSEIAVFRSGNMSLGINLLMSLVTKAASILDGFDIEIIVTV